MSGLSSVLWGGGVGGSGKGMSGRLRGDRRCTSRNAHKATTPPDHTESLSTRAKGRGVSVCLGGHLCGLGKWRGCRSWLGAVLGGAGPRLETWGTACPTRANPPPTYTQHRHSTKALTWLVSRSMHVGGWAMGVPVEGEGEEGQHDEPQEVTRPTTPPVPHLRHTPQRGR